MPRIRHWYHASQYLNHDPEFIKLRREFADWMGYVWHEMLAWGDRTEGELKGELSEISLTLARVSPDMYPRRAAHLIEKAFRYMQDVGWIEIRSDRILIVNYAKYNPSRGANKIPLGNGLAQPLSSSSSSPSNPPNEKEEEEETKFSQFGKQGNGIDIETPVQHKSARKKVKKEWPADGFFIRDFLAQQTFFDSHFDPEILPKVKDKLDDAQWWEDLSHAVNGLDGETLHRNFAAISVWMHDHPQRIPTARGLRSFIARWFQGAAEDERKKPWLIAKRAAKLLRR
jgi:hypothetical protein